MVVLAYALTFQYRISLPSRPYLGVSPFHATLQRILSIRGTISNEMKDERFSCPGVSAP